MVSISRRQLAKVISEMLDSGTSTDQVASQTAAYLLLHRRIKELPSLMRDILAFRAENGMVEVTATSARDFDEKVRIAVESLIKANFPNVVDIVLHKQLNPAVVGGVHLSSPGMDLDLTVQNRLKQLTLVK